MEVETPRRFGPYVLVRMLDGGGQGRVDLALMGETGRERICVIKRMLPELVGADARARFDHELKITRRLSHAAVVRTFAVDEIEGEPCIVQEYVEGHSLAYVMSVCGTQRKPIPVALAVYMVHEVVRALGYVHDFENLGLVHRDISPANIQLAFSGEVKLLDFGVAKSEVQDFKTATGQFVGRPAFVAPEVYLGRKADRRADIYSTGIVLWGLLARRFVGDVRDANGALPPPSSLNPEIPAEADEVVAKALAARPEERYQDAPSFGRALESFLPAGFDGAAAVTELLGSLFDIEAERRMRGLDVGEARHLLPEHAAGAHSPPAGKRLARIVAAGAVVAALGGGAIAYSRMTSTVPAGTQAVQVAPAVPLVAPEAAVIPATAEVSTPEPYPVGQVSAKKPALGGAGTPRSSAAKSVPDPARSATELTEEAQQRLGEEKFDDAIRLARAAIKAGAGADARILLARGLLETGQRPAAERELVAATRLEPGNSAASKFLREIREAREQNR